LDKLPADFQFRSPGIRSRVRHDKASSSVVVQGAVENLYPEVIGVINLGQAEKEARIVFEAVFVYPINIERRICENEIELAGAIMQVFIIGISLSDVPASSMDGKVHLFEADSFKHPLLPINADFRTRVLLMFFDKMGALDKHPT